MKEFVGCGLVRGNVVYRFMSCNDCKFKANNQKCKEFLDESGYKKVLIYLTDEDVSALKELHMTDISRKFKTVEEE